MSVLGSTTNLIDLLDLIYLPSFSTTAFFLSFILTTILSYYCYKPPNPPPRTVYPGDTLFAWLAVHHHSAFFGLILLTLTWTFYLLVLLAFNLSPTNPSLLPQICLHPSLLNPNLFTWSLPTLSFISAILIFAPLRLNAYSRLGTNFTFELARPNQLITSGIYAYIQHPSYTGLFVVNAANHFFMQRLDGMAACVLPAWWLGGESWRWWVSLVAPVVSTVAVGLGLLVRVRDEEEMLRKEFGREWEVWHGMTKRFVPGVI